VRSSLGAHLLPLGLCNQLLELGNVHRRRGNGFAKVLRAAALHKLARLYCPPELLATDLRAGRRQLEGQQGDFGKVLASPIGVYLVGRCSESRTRRPKVRTSDTAQLALERHHSLPQLRAPQPSFSCLKYDSTVFLISSSAFDSIPGDLGEAM
jgi:hypothetical protein